MNHFLMKDKTKEQDEASVDMLKEKIKLAETCMGTSNVDYLLWYI